MKTKETLIGTVITNTGDKPSMKITNVLPADNKGHFRTDYDYVIQVDDLPEKHTVESLGLKGLPKSLEKSTRQQALALEWWHNLISDGLKAGYAQKHLQAGFRYKSLTGREIEEIYKSEVVVKELSDSYHNVEYLNPNQKQDEWQKETENWLYKSNKSNQKQFVEFSPELFKKYISKFSDEDKIKALKILNGFTLDQMVRAYSCGYGDRDANLPQFHGNKPFEYINKLK